MKSSGQRDGKSFVPLSFLLWRRDNSIVFVKVSLSDGNSIFKVMTRYYFWSQWEASRKHREASRDNLGTPGKNLMTFDS
ncbi:MAG: hypothetical protein LBH60_00395 [Prevotellaceae bacterium]|nr:hypothetical protein [Prevotellaceae bacterium]